MHCQPNDVDREHNRGDHDDSDRLHNGFHRVHHHGPDDDRSDDGRNDDNPEHHDANPEHYDDGCPYQHYWHDDDDDNPDQSDVQTRSASRYDRGKYHPP